MRAGVGGGWGFVLRDVEGREWGGAVVEVGVEESGFLEGVKGSLVISGKEES